MSLPSLNKVITYLLTSCVLYIWTCAIQSSCLHPWSDSHKIGSLPEANQALKCFRPESFHGDRISVKKKEWSGVCHFKAEYSCELYVGCASGRIIGFVCILKLIYSVGTYYFLTVINTFQVQQNSLKTFKRLWNSSFHWTS